MAQENTPLIKPQAQKDSQDFSYDGIDRKLIPNIERERGTEFLRINEINKASKSFSKAIMAFEYLIKDSKITPEEIKAMLKETIIPCYSNLTLCYMKLQHYQSVANFASRVLDVERDNIKAFYRRGIAYKKLKRFRQSREDFNRVKALDQTMADQIQKQLREIVALEQKEKQKQKKIAQALISGYYDQNHTRSTVDPPKPVIEQQKEGRMAKVLRNVKGWCSKLKDMISRKK